MRIAKTLSNILESPVVRTALDRSKPIESVLDDVKDAWKVDLDNRKPAPVYREVIEGMMVYQGTDFDLFTFMNALADREAVINLPNYEGIAPKTVRSDQRVISNKNRHGSVMGVIANKEAHSFNVRIKDYNVVETKPDGREIVGVPRNFALVDYGGQWHDGWHRIEFKPDAKENEFLAKNGLWTGNSVVFKNFVHPNLSNAFFGSRYLETKALGSRVTDEAGHYREQAAMLRGRGITLGRSDYTQRPFITRDESNVESVRVENLEARLLLPDFSGKYPIKATDEDGRVRVYRQMPTNPKAMRDVLRFAENRASELSYKVGPELTAPIRAVELAYFKNGFVGERAPGNEKQPGWAIPEWERGYTIGGGRTEWNALKLNDNATLVYRIRQTAVRKVA